MGTCPAYLAQIQTVRMKQLGGRLPMHQLLPYTARQRSSSSQVHASCKWLCVGMAPTDARSDIIRLHDIQLLCDWVLYLMLCFQFALHFKHMLFISAKGYLQSLPASLRRTPRQSLHCCGHLCWAANVQGTGFSRYGERCCIQTRGTVSQNLRPCQAC